MSASLAVVATNPSPDTANEPLYNRIRRLQAEAKAMAREHVNQLEAQLAQMAALAAEIADGGDAYPVGAREMARQLVADCETRALALEAIMRRTGAPH